MARRRLVGRLMRALRLKIALGVLAGILIPASEAAESSVLSGRLLGQVKNGAGISQMGATVLLFDRFDQLVRRALTDTQGRFGFDGLPPESYTVRVTMASFVPAMRRHIAVRAGVESVLEINLASVFSSIELVYNAPGRGALMSDDWKWVLRASQSTRPVLRFLPASSTSPARHSAMFSDTRGLVKVSAGDGSSFGGATQQDLGTAFALATSLFGTNRLQLSGNLGYTTASGIPAAGFRSTYRRNESAGAVTPEISLTMRQLYLPVRVGSAILSSQEPGAPALRTMSLGTIDRKQVTEDLKIEYGFSLESVSFLDRLNYFSPFARATYALNDVTTFKIAYSSGATPVELLNAPNGEAEAELSENLTALGLLPRVTLAGGRAHVQRTENIEIGLTHIEGNRTWSAGAYRESVSNGAFTMAAPNGFVQEGDLLPDLTSRSSVFNVGRYERFGYNASVAQTLNEHLEVSIAVGRAEALVADGQVFSSADAQELRRMIHKARRGWVTARVAGSVPVTGTRVTTSYGWTDFRSLMPAHLFLTQRTAQEIGWNFYVRQPLPGSLGMPGRLEATAELRNLLAQGYLSVLSSDNRTAQLIHTPRAMRAGLAFIF